ncbi:MAG: tRNA pseudouridine(55) synthase TruB [Thermodesulfobacteriota bacterium]
MHGILLVDKPEGMTSSQVVRVVKKLVRPAKVGHTGTLDPAASGLLVILIGAGTRALDYLDEAKKEYLPTVLLGEETDTDDREGRVTRSEDPSGISSEQIEEVLKRYRGVIDQIPPHFSAVKKEGVPLYKLARGGTLVDLPPRKVEIFSLTLLSWEAPLLDLHMVCSKGTYARALARDIGRDLNVGGRLERLRRTASGNFRVEAAVTLEEISEGGAELIRQKMVSLSDALSHIPNIRALVPEIKRLMRGSSVVVPRSRLPLPETNAQQSVNLLKVVSPDGSLLILVRLLPGRGEIALQTVRVFQTYQQ